MSDESMDKAEKIIKLLNDNKSIVMWSKSTYGKVECGLIESNAADLIRPHLVPEWISVKDRLPESDDSVLAAWGSNKNNVSTLHYQANYTRYGKPVPSWFWYGKLSPFSITHWQPLPEAPNG